MPDPIRMRFDHLFAVLLRPSWTWLVIGLGGVGGTAALIRDEFLPPQMAAQLKVLKMLPDWPWTAYAALVLLVLLAVMFEGSFRAALADKMEIARLRSEAADLRAQVLARRKNGVVQQAVSAARVRLIEIATTLRNTAQSDAPPLVDAAEVSVLLAKLLPEERRAWSNFQAEHMMVQTKAELRRRNPAPWTEEEVAAAFAGDTTRSMNEAARDLIDLLLMDE